VARTHIALKQHIIDAHKKKEDLHICDPEHCGATFLTHALMLQHLKKAHNDPPPFNCDECKIGFFNKKKFTEHCLEKHDPKPLKCEKCEYSTEYQSALTQHLKTHTGERSHVCDAIDCGEAFTTSSHLDRHKECHTGDLRYKCLHCRFTSSKDACFKIHMTKHHPTFKGHKCDQCEAMFDNRSDLERHKLYKHTEIARTFICLEPDCGQAFRFKDDLAKHQKGVHGEKKYKCDFLDCDYCTSYKPVLAEHKLTHGEDRPYKCLSCNFTAKNRSLLRNHMISHKEATIQCPKCSHKSKTQKALGLHLKVHSDDRPHPCTYPGCSYASKTKATLDDHMLRHAGIRPHKCTFTLCDFAATKKNDLNDHIKSMHSEEGFQRRKTQENTIRQFLVEQKVDFDTQTHIDLQCFEAKQNTNKKFARLDFVIERPHATFIVEIDERQHSEFGYLLSCELRRMLDVHASIMTARAVRAEETKSKQVDRPMVWIRYNPDSFEVDENLQKVPGKDRRAKLMEFIDNYLPSKPLEIVYMYYSCRSNDSDVLPLVPVIFDDPDYLQCVKELVTEVVCD